MNSLQTRCFLQILASMTEDGALSELENENESKPFPVFKIDPVKPIESSPYSPINLGPALHSFKYDPKYEGAREKCRQQ